MAEHTAGEPPVDTEQLETYRRLAERLTSLPETEAPRSILLTATNPGEGCSTVAGNLALSLARRPGTRVLLVELDPKGSPLQPEATGGHGLLQVLAGSTVLDAAVRESSTADLSVLPRGESLNGFPGGTEGGAFAHLLQEARKTYTHAVIDGPPIAGLPPGILPHVDGVILVIEANRSRREAVVAGLKYLQGSGARVLGTVFNKREFFIPDWLYRRLS